MQSMIFIDITQGNRCLKNNTIHTLCHLSLSRACFVNQPLLFSCLFVFFVSDEILFNNLVKCVKTY